MQSLQYRKVKRGLRRTEKRGLPLQGDLDRPADFLSQILWRLANVVSFHVVGDEAVNLVFDGLGVKLDGEHFAYVVGEFFALPLV